MRNGFLLLQGVAAKTKKVWVAKKSQHAGAQPNHHVQVPIEEANEGWRVARMWMCKFCLFMSRSFIVMCNVRKVFLFCYHSLWFAFNCYYNFPMERVEENLWEYDKRALGYSWRLSFYSLLDR